MNWKMIFFRPNHLPLNEEVIYKSETVAPEQEALLGQPNSDQYPPAQGSSAGKVTPKNPNEQEPEQGNVEQNVPDRVENNPQANSNKKPTIRKRVQSRRLCKRYGRQCLTM